MQYTQFVLGAVSVAATALCACSSDSTGATPQPIARGAVFTTMPDGMVITNGEFSAREAVHICGGAEPNAAAGPAGLPAGDYYFQVTDPSGLKLLSEDDIECRRVRVNDQGVFDQAYAGPGCEHVTAPIASQAAAGAIAVQLRPYANTPSATGGYHVWITAVDSYDPAHTTTHGFIAAASKTAAFHVIVDSPSPVCGNGVRENSEMCDDGNTVGEDGCAADCTLEAQN